MTAARIRLLIAAALFLGWLGWLAYAVLKKDTGPVVSRAQLTAATHLLVAEVAVGADGLPESKVKIVEVLRGDGLDKSQPADVTNLAAAMPPGANGFPGAGTYLLPVVHDGLAFRVAGLPRSPGYEAATPGRPTIYVWNDHTRTQLKALGLLQ